MTQLQAEEEHVSQKKIKNEAGRRDWSNDYIERWRLLFNTTLRNY